ncbi:MAG TPA: trypsin-like peptidase domain-containing protein [Candidatus Limnocylindrales bacterium]|nr:trypsin-like peptidase domain-containing protein [Candidatus Limnocylindrales bacterium]
MKAERVVAGVVGVSLLLGGYALSELEKPGTPIEAIDPSVLPDELPPAVEETQPRAMTIARRRLDGQNKNTELEYGSAVALTSTIGITAGHVLFRNQPTKLGSFEIPFTEEAVPIADKCESIRVSSTTKTPKLGWTLERARINIYGKSTPVMRYAGEANLEDEETDLALFTLSKPLDLDLKRMPIRKSRVRRGESLFFFNYQPDEGGGRRMPDQSYISATGERGKYSSPAIYGGIALGYTEGERLGVATSFRSYGHTNETSVRRGASGGQIVDAEGRLVGVTSMYYEADLPVVSKVQGSHPASAKSTETQRATIAVVQTVSEKHIEELGEQMADAPICTAVGSIN